MRRFTLVAMLLLAACGSPTPGGAGHSPGEVIVAADAAPGSVAESNWRRFANNVRVWAPGMRLGAEAGAPARRANDAKGGAVQVASLPPEAAKQIVPELAVLSAPDVFASRSEADHILDKVVIDSYRRLFAAQGLVLLGWVDDDWTDPQTRHAYGTGVIVANQAWFERLTPHDRDVFQQAYSSAGEARADVRAGIDAGAAAEGPAEWNDAIREAHRAIIARSGGSGQEIYDLIVRARQDFAARQAASSASGATAAPR
jgi:TRAP-type C4-dicarboxylate transport system substrate-binding protein